MANNYIPVRLEYSGGSVPTGWAEYQTNETMLLPGSLQFTGSGRLIFAPMGDTAGAFGNRLFFQSSTTNSNTLISTKPNGTSTTSGLQAWANSGDLENSTRLDAYITAGEAHIESGRTGTGTYVPLAMYTGGAVRVRLNTDGSVEFPTAGTRITGDMSNATVASRLLFQTSTANGATSISAIPNGTGNVAVLSAFSAATAANCSFAALYTDGVGSYVSSDRLGTGTYLPLIFTVGGAERMRFASNGTLQVATTNLDPIGVGVQGFIVNSNGQWQNFVNSGTAANMGVKSTAGALIAFYYNPSGTLAGVGSITTNGTATSYNTSSDYRLKDDVQPLDPIEATGRIMAYRPVTWTWKTDGSFGKGFIAHECQAVDPMTATGTKDEMERVGIVVLADGAVAAESVREPEDPSIYGEGATWELTEVRAVYQGRDDSKMIPDMIAMMQRMELRIRELEGQLQQALSQLQAA